MNMAKIKIAAMLALVGLIMELQAGIDAKKSERFPVGNRPFTPPRAQWTRVAALGHHIQVP